MEVEDQVVTTQEETVKTEQEDVTKWLPKRLARERKNALKEFALEHGFNSIDELAKKFEEVEQPKEEDKKVETQDTPVTDNKVSELENRLKDMEEKLLKEKQAGLKAKVEKEIVEKVATTVEFPEDVVKKIFEEKSFSDFVDDNGNINQTLISESIENVKKVRPNYFKKAIVGSPSNSTANTNKVDDEKLKERISITDRQLSKIF